MKDLPEVRIYRVKWLKKGVLTMQTYTGWNHSWYWLSCRNKRV